jgi:hypothetical protein
MPGFQEAIGRVIGRGNFFGKSGFTGPDLGEERGGARKVGDEIFSFREYQMKKLNDKSR